MQCAVLGCAAAAFRRTWCRRHYMRWWRHGNPEGGAADKPARDGRRTAYRFAFTPKHWAVWLARLNGEDRDEHTERLARGIAYVRQRIEAEGFKP